MSLAFLNIGTQEMMLIVIVILFLFGGKKLPELARGLGRGIREFKDASEGIKREISDQINNFERDLDVQVEEKKTDVTQSTKATALAQEINTNASEKAEPVNAESFSKESKLPKFGPPAGTYQHNPNSDTAEDPYDHYYKHGYQDHFESQNDVAYTPAPDQDSASSEEQNDNNTDKPVV